MSTPDPAGMTLTEIHAAVEAGKRVCWMNPMYTVIKDSVGQWLIHCAATDAYWGLTHRDGVTVNGKPGDFFVYDPARPAYAVTRVKA